MLEMLEDGSMDRRIRTRVRVHTDVSSKIINEH